MPVLPSEYSSVIHHIPKQVRTYRVPVSRCKTTTNRDKDERDVCARALYTTEKKSSSSSISIGAPDLNFEHLRLIVCFVRSFPQTKTTQFAVVTLWAAILCPSIRLAVFIDSQPNGSSDDGWRKQCPPSHLSRNFGECKLNQIHLNLCVLASEQFNRQRAALSALIVFNFK